MLAAIVPGVRGRLARHGLDEDDGSGGDRFADAAPLLAGLAAASVTGFRLSVDAERRVVLQLRHPWSDGTTHLRCEPTAFLERLAVLVPRPRSNLLLYYGVLAPPAAWRAEVVPRAATAAESCDASGASDAGVPVASPSRRRWADLMRRAFDVDVLACPRCGGRRRSLAAMMPGHVSSDGQHLVAITPRDTAGGLTIV